MLKALRRLVVVLVIAKSRETTMKEVDIYFISGLMFGMEYIPDYEGDQGIVIDFLFVRVTFLW
jgi:hypothetical protein